MLTALDAILVALLVLSGMTSLVAVAYLPLSLVAAARTRARPPVLDALPSVSVIVPAYNEEVVLARCLESILRDDYPDREVIVVDDGSSDGTWQIMCRFRRRGRIRAIRQDNAGKAAALNRGIAQASGDVLVFVDADGVFTGDTLRRLVAGFADGRVGAVCGNDAPVNLDRVQPRLLALLTHVTAMVRRALGTVNCLTIVSGNCGAFRRDVLERTGLFQPGIIGEDLELTWRVRKAGYRVAFCPAAIVHAEVPSTIAMLWRQRVRWSRGYLQTWRLHRALVGRGGHGVLGPYLAFNVFGMVFAPLFQLAGLVILAALVAADGREPWQAPTGALSWLTFALPLISVVLATLIDRAPSDLRLLYVMVLMPLYSLMMSLVLVVAIGQELRRRPAVWNKFERTGSASRPGARSGVFVMAAGLGLALAGCAMEPAPTSEPSTTSAGQDPERVMTHSGLGFLRGAAATCGDGQRLPPSYHSGELAATEPRVAYTYDAALTVLALLASGDAADRTSGLEVADALLAVQSADPADDGRVRDAYDCAPLEDGELNVAAWGTSTGNVAWTGLALLAAHRADPTGPYLAGAVRLGEWIVAHTADTRGAGGYRGGLPADGEPIAWKSTEHNIDVLALFTQLDAAADGPWQERADAAREFLGAMIDADGHLWVGSGTDGVSVNRDDYVPQDAQTWAYLASPDAAHSGALDWAVANLTARDGELTGALVGTSEPDNAALWLEGNGHMAAALRCRGAAGDEELARRLLESAAAMQEAGGGIPAASRTGTAGGDSPIHAAAHTGATAWVVLAAQRVNPLGETCPAAPAS